MFLASTNFVFIYGTMLGFAFAGLSACAFEYATDRRLHFEIAHGTNIVEGVCGFLIRIVAGPYLVARFIHGLAMENSHPLVVGAGSLLVVAWSLSLGIVIISSLLT